MLPTHFCKKKRVYQYGEKSTEEYIISTKKEYPKKIISCELKQFEKNSRLD